MTLPEAYWRDDKRGLVIYHGDCREVLPTFADGQFGSVITDPPYFISRADKDIDRGNGSRFKGTPIKYDFGVWDHSEDPADFTAEWVSQASRILSPGGALVSYYDRSNLSHLIIPLLRDGLKLRNIIADCKANPCPQLRKAGWAVGWEAAVVFEKPGRTRAYQWREGHHPDWFFRPVNWPNRLHPNEKCRAVMDDILRWWARRDMPILDPFMGSGTTLVAAAKLGIPATGIEISEKYCRMAVCRLEGGFMDDEPAHLFNQESIADDSRG